MYKKFFMAIAAMAALTLVSCSSEDLNSLSDNSSKGGAISFDGYLGRSAVAVNGTRGSEVKIDQLKTGGFGVFGKYTPTEGQASNLFDNQKVTYSTSTTPTESKWTYENTKYWPTEGHIDFLAYAPYVGETTLKNNKSIDFTVADKVANQKDLLWANAANKKKADNPVKFTFNHALSRLGYTVKLKDAYSDATITLKKITLAGSADGVTKKAFYTTGTIDLSMTSSTGLWTISNPDAKQNFEWYSGDHQLTITEYTPDASYLFVIPQDFSQKTSGADELYVIVEYTIQTGSTATMTSKVYKKLERKFEQGKAYTINLTIGLTPIEFDAEVTDWDTTNGTSIDINSWD